MSVPNPVRRRQFGQQRQQNCAGAGAEIGDAQRAIEVAAGAHQLQRQFDHRLGIGPRHQRRGRELQRQSPEFLLAENARDRLAREAPARILRQSAASAEVSRRRLRDHAGQVEAEHGCQKNARIEFGVIDAGGFESRRQRPPRALNLGPGSVTNVPILPAIVDRPARMLASTEPVAFDRSVSRGTVKAMTAYDDQNVFAKILRGEIPCFKVHENDRALAFLDIMPRSPGHTLVIPKAPARGILDIAEDDLAEVARSAKRIAIAAMKAFDADGIILQQFSEPASGQVVFHLHMHVMPVKAGIELLPPQTRKEDPAVLCGSRQADDRCARRLIARWRIRRRGNAVAIPAAPSVPAPAPRGRYGRC